MSLPVNKKTLDTKITTDLANNSTQAITATILRNTLAPIVNSTFGLKTIWSGFVNATFNYGGSGTTQFNNSAIFVCEDYYDPNYFPALDPNNLDAALASYQAAGCRYKLISQGSNLTGSDGTYTTSISNPTINSTTPGTGLTFDVKISGGSVIAIKVNNQGTGYCWGRYGSSLSGLASLYTPTEVEIQIPYSGGGSRPKIRIDLSNVINMDMRAGSQNSGSFLYKYLNFFIPSASTTIGYGQNIYLQTIGTTLGMQNPNGRIKSGACDFTDTFFIPYPFNSSDVSSTKGYYTTFLEGSADGSSYNSTFKLEVKVPIINTTI